jgi:hypothetical protein
MHKISLNTFTHPAHSLTNLQLAVLVLQMQMQMQMQMQTA